MFPGCINQKRVEYAFYFAQAAGNKAIASCNCGVSGSAIEFVFKPRDMPRSKTTQVFPAAKGDMGDIRVSFRLLRMAKLSLFGVWATTNFSSPFCCNKLLKELFASALLMSPWS